MSAPPLPPLNCAGCGATLLRYGDDASLEARPHHRVLSRKRELLDMASVVAGFVLYEYPDVCSLECLAAVAVSWPDAFHGPNRSFRAQGANLAHAFYRLDPLEAVDPVELIGPTGAFTAALHTLGRGSRWEIASSVWGPATLQSRAAVNDLWIPVPRDHNPWKW